MSLTVVGVIEIPGATGSEFDHGVSDSRSRRAFIAHTKRGRVEVIDPDASRHGATLPGFPGAAGAVADDGKSWSPIVDRQASHGSTPPRSKPDRCFQRAHGRTVRPLSNASCSGSPPASATRRETPTLQAFRLNDGRHVRLDLPGRPRWCVTDAAAERLFLCIREPSMILVAGLPDLRPLAQWPLPSDGAHGLDIDHARERLYAACDAW